MNRRTFLANSAGLMGELAPAKAVRQPNIVFILIDDYGWRDTSYNGSTFYETPNIDSLARGGMVFTNGYSASPVCSPTRAAIMTGKYPARLHLTSHLQSATNRLHYSKVHPCRSRAAVGRGGSLYADFCRRRRVRLRPSPFSDGYLLAPHPAVSRTTAALHPDPIVLRLI